MHRIFDINLINITEFVDGDPKVNTLCEGSHPLHDRPSNGGIQRTMFQNAFFSIFHVSWTGYIKFTLTAFTIGS
jgi:hypothetical protein